MAATETPARRLEALLDALVDDRVGIIGRVEVVPAEPGAPPFFHLAAQACNTASFSRQANFAMTGGAAPELRRAAIKAVGEAVERYCAALYAVEDLPLSTYREAPFACVDPAAFALYSPEQYAEPSFPWVPFDRDTPVRWAPALDPLTGETVHVPAAMVYIPYHYYRGTGDAPIGQPISTGLACHSTPENAAASGICEVLERDAFTLVWQGRMSPPQLRVETLSDRNYDLVSRFEQAGGSVTLFDLTLDIRVPSVLAVLRGNAPTAPALVFAAATDLSPEGAVRKALEELAHTRRYSQQIMTRLPRVAAQPPYDAVRDQVSHLNFWADHANAPHAEFLFASPQRIDFDDMADESTGQAGPDLEKVLRRVSEAGYRTLLTDVTTPDVRPLGLTVCRAIVPGLHPLFMGHRLRALGGERLWRIPRQLGYAGVVRETGDNSFPHPYP